jgi:hypothetical protein
MLHTLFSDVPVEQQETVAGGNEISCSCSNKEFSPEESKNLNEILKRIFGFTLP